MELNGKQRRALRALGHHREPVVMIGKDGVTESLINATNQALTDHELIKVRVGESSPIDRHEAAEVLAQATSSAVAQVLGRTILLFRRHPEDPQIALPGLPLPPKKPAPPPAAKRPGKSHAFGSRRRE
ncbi:MAG: ribosome assembly RNA-binding protein YhbY [Deltaproteobacteria bacterium]|nr:ribosome assembly RNA-binding protein YhbY [Deltaproteobacteria bacterium]